MSDTPLVDQPEIIDLVTADSILIKQATIKDKGSWIPQHAHVYDHTTAIAAGGIKVWQDGVYDGEYRAPALIFIKARVKHLFQTTADNTTIWCIHNAMRPDVAAVFAEHQITLD